MLAMIDSLDWWTCRTRYYMCYRERCRLTIDQKREYACSAEYLLRLQYTSLSNFMTGISILDEWTHTVPFDCHTSGARWLPVAELALWICERLLMWNLSVARTQIPLENFAIPESFLLNKFPRKSRAIMKRMTFWISKFHFYKKKIKDVCQTQFLQKCLTLIKDVKKKD